MECIDYNINNNGGDNMKEITRSYSGMPTIVESEIEEGCCFNNTLFGGYGTLVIDKKFIDRMKSIANEAKDEKNFVKMLTIIKNSVEDYFYSSEKNSKSREEVYEDNVVTDDEGMIIGTNISSLKGKNVAKCSEKSIASFIVLKELNKMGIVKRKPYMVLSKLATENSDPEPHAFIMINLDEQNDATKYLLFDPENSTIVKDKSNQQIKVVGLYILNDEQYDSLMKGSVCSPISLFEFSGWYQEVGEKRTYGNIEENKTL